MKKLNYSTLLLPQALEEARDNAELRLLHFLWRQHVARNLPQRPHLASMKAVRPNVEKRNSHSFHRISGHSHRI